MNKRNIADVYENVNNDKNENVDVQLQNLITSLESLIAKSSDLLKHVQYPKMLISGLRDLSKMVEMFEIKKQIIYQVKFLITNTARLEQMKLSGLKSMSSPFEDHMLHSIISGNPGTGKTTVAKILAKIWTGVGMIKGDAKKNNTSNHSEETIRYLSQRLAEVHVLAQQLLNINHDLSKDICSAKVLYNFNDDDISEDLESALNLSRSMKNNISELIMRSEDSQIQHRSVVNITLTSSGLIITGTTGRNSTSDDSMVEPKFTIATRDTLVAEYVGQTAIKTKAVLDKARGGVLLIDEAYSLYICNDDRVDVFGEECLTTINEYMSLYPDELIIIFAGYKDRILNSIFKAQPGFHRRVHTFFEIEDYSAKALAEIFKIQLNKASWKMEDIADFIGLIDENIDIIGNGGTEKLLLHAKLVYADFKFDETVKLAHEGINNSDIHDSIITSPMIKIAIEKLRENSAKSHEKKEEPPAHMYI